ncbi:hypothetical protein FisN_15Lh231 [Fistulifera solaris]|uniref:Uncharacterized protein n=1 Tax=Fistulifera solaris TaxID=1519565 RepID=A0A1Z5JBM5_FISSO|nr:hypothetical protein FisN_15Lh231 [Fistulifera solaris]|eukprot:GAX11302.1 hypothetical protein FisN_15Lh231 [Fistulifera solaris]
MDLDMNWLEDDDDIDMVEGVVNEPNNDANLPVAVPVHDVLRHRRRQLARIIRGRDRLRMYDAPFAQGVIEGEDVPAWMEAEEAQEESSSFLMDLVREDLPCSAVLSGSKRRGCSTIVQRITENPEEVGYRCPRTDRTPLHEAALRCSCRHVIHAMMEVGTYRALQLDFRMNTPLHLLFMGISTRHIESEDMRQILDVLLEPYPPIGTMANGDGDLPIHCALAAPETMLPPGVIDRLVRASPTSVSRLNRWGQTALHLHCQRRNASVELAEYLLNLAPESIQLRDRSDARGFTPFHYAASNSNHAVIALFARRDPFSAGIVSLISGKTPLHILCQQNPTTAEDVESIKRLLVAAPNAATLTDQDASSTPLHLVCRGARTIHFPIVGALVRAAAEALLIQDVNGYLPLHHALENGADSDVVRCLLDVEKRAAILQTRKHDTALSLACTANKSVEAVKILLEANPAATLQPNDYGFLPIHCSCRAYQAQCMIVRELLYACPQAALKLTNGGESAMHLASNNSSASVAIIDVLSKTYQTLREENGAEEMHASPLRDKVLTSTVGNTPLHLACFRDFSRPHIESLAASNPSWISVRNNAGYSPLQILCKNGRIDDRIVTLFSRLCGPQIFSDVDLMGNTPLHSAIREEMDVEALRAIIRAYPDALHMKTTYDDTPLHLAVLRKVNPEVVREVALASSAGLESALATCNGRISPILIQNTAGQTPIGIAMEEYQKLCKGSTCTLHNNVHVYQMRCFTTLSILAKILHYGPSGNENNGQSLVGACIALHRKGARIDPAYIHRALHMFPEEARVADVEGNTPLHIEASIPIEKMSLLDGNVVNCCDGSYHQRIGVLRKLLEIYPEAAKIRNNDGDFPLTLMIQNGRPWDSSFALVVRTYPQALHWVSTIDAKLLPHILARVSSHCGSDTLFALLRGRPEFLLAH